MVTYIVLNSTFLPFPSFCFSCSDNCIASVCNQSILQSIKILYECSIIFFLLILVFFVSLGTLFVSFYLVEFFVVLALNQVVFYLVIAESLVQRSVCLAVDFALYSLLSR